MTRVPPLARVAIITAIESGMPLHRVFSQMLHEDLRFETLAHATLVAVGALIALVASTSPWAVALLVIPIIVTHYTLSHQTRLRLEAERARIMSDASLAEAQRLARVGSWKWYPKKNRWVWSDEAYRIFGVAPRATFPTLSDVLAIVHPAERASVERTLSEAERNRAAFAKEHQIQRHDGTARYVEQRGAVLPSENGSVVLYGTEYWEGMMQWIRDKPLYEEKISPEDLHLLTITSDIDEACEAIAKHHRSREQERKETASQQATKQAVQEADAGRSNR